MSGFCQTKLLNNAKGEDVHKATLDVSEAALALSRLLEWHERCRVGCLNSKDVEDLAVALKENKVGVIEGVAGIGKTFVLRALCRLLDCLCLEHHIGRLDQLIGLWTQSQAAIDVIDLVTAAGDRKRWETEATLILMHPSSSYEEIVGGIRPEGREFFWRPGALTRAVERAQQDFREGLPRLHLVMLDEINRCNVASVLGEVMLLVESSRRVDGWLASESYPEAGNAREEWKRDGRAVELPSARKQLSAGEYPDSGQTGTARDDYWLWLPSNLVLLGTMNSSDRSILGFDQALRRRFPPIRLEPHTVEEWLEQLRCWKANGLSEETLALVTHEILAWASLNVVLRARIGPDAMIGHSYLYEALKERGKDQATLAIAFTRMWRYGILPQVIHAAESSRQLDFACHLWMPPKQRDGSKSLFESGGGRGIGDRALDDALSATGYPLPARHFKKWVEKYGVAGASQARFHELAVVGQGQGRRLLVQKIVIPAEDKLILKNLAQWVAKGMQTSDLKSQLSNLLVQDESDGTP